MEHQRLTASDSRLSVARHHMEQDQQHTGGSPSNYSSLAAALTMPPDYQQHCQPDNSLGTSRSVPFQLPSFLTGIPTPVQGGGADVFPGSFASMGDFTNWFGGSSSPYQDHNQKSTEFHDKSAQSEFQWCNEPIPKLASPDPPAPTATRITPNAPFTYGTQPSSTPKILTYDPPQTTSIPFSNIRSLPQSSINQLTGSSAPPLYSTTGFDMMGILARVAARPNPQIVLGPVDFSCSFVLVDVRRYDHPVVYASPTFLKLTGYDSNEVIGRNCRFLQAPDGNVVKGSQRTFTDPSAVSHINKSLVNQKECQANLMNYRKGGEPFLNLISVIPISWGDDSDGEGGVRYHVGFQVDLVHQPNAILQTMRDGSYLVNYSNMMGGGGPTAGLISTNATKGGLGFAHGGFGVGRSSISREMRDVMGAILPGGKKEMDRSSDEKNRHDLNTLLLDQCDDFVHVLSVKGIIQYASPSLLSFLEYTSSELIGKHLSDISHPQDLTPVTRQLKESSSASKTVRLLYRVRRKRSGMVWMESCGRLHAESGKTRKSVVFVGRVRVCWGIKWGDIQKAGGLAATNVGPSTNSSEADEGDKREFWARVSSRTGLLVWVSESAANVLLDSQSRSRLHRRQSSKTSNTVAKGDEDGDDDEDDDIVMDEKPSAGGTKDVVGTRVQDWMASEADWMQVRNAMEKGLRMCGSTAAGESVVVEGVKMIRKRTDVTEDVNDDAEGEGDGEEIAPATHHNSPYKGEDQIIEGDLVIYVPDSPVSVPKICSSLSTFSPTGSPTVASSSSPLNMSRTSPNSVVGVILSPAKPSSLLIQFRYRPPRNMAPSPLSSNDAILPPQRISHDKEAKIYEELDVARASNWCYEVEKVRQVNEKLKSELAAASEL